ncbi:hypothetical protein VIGAN_03135900 [Vigna angularis var. angularis]|uniref:Uncharacterized protein n=1 Tax=Vigna angularis var. angularis TaxID=157739 RepID=A0A0S3RLY2_PHAAN|nr:hypothetical protein VIGAN_03135900 [Vigna angularis var. angularis]
MIRGGDPILRFGRVVSGVGDENEEERDENIGVGREVAKNGECSQGDSMMIEDEEPLYIDDLEDILDQGMLSLNVEVEDGSIEEESQSRASNSSSHNGYIRDTVCAKFSIKVGLSLCTWKS